MLEQNITEVGLVQDEFFGVFLLLNETDHFFDIPVVEVFGKTDALFFLQNELDV